MRPLGARHEDLLRPESYPEPRPDQVETRTTHASRVYLTPREAWKVKRSVDFGFLDFTTREKRRRACEAELHLNRRLAPDVYLDVVPVRRDARGDSFSREGEVVDWAVRMRRLPDDRTAAALLRGGTLGPDHLEAVARRLVPFYAAALETPDGGLVETLRTNIDENFHQVEPFLGTLVEPVSFRAVRARQESFLRDYEGRLKERIAAGRIRDGHGDLRLEHVYFLDGAPVIIDCIEFNERFRHADVAADVAFLAMELDAAGREDLAAWFLSRFAMRSGDYDLYGVVDFYLTYRAWVRGKVACFVVADAETPDEVRRAKTDEAFRMFELAERYSRPAPHHEAVIAVGGLIGTGKSTLAEGLSLSLRSPHVSSDATRKNLFGVELTDRLPAAAYAPEVSNRTYAELFRRAELVLDSGRGVLLDATFRDRDSRHRARDLARRHGRPFLFLEARCDERIVRERLRRRAEEPSVSDATEAQMSRMTWEGEPTEGLTEAEHLAVDTAGRPEETVAAVRARLESLGIGLGGGVIRGPWKDNAVVWKPRS